MLTPPPNTVITFSADNFLNSTAEYACTSGYLFVGGQVRTCTISGWTGSEPVCQGTQASKRINSLYMGDNCKLEMLLQQCKGGREEGGGQDIISFVKETYSVIGSKHNYAT